MLLFYRMVVKQHYINFRLKNKLTLLGRWNFWLLTEFFVNIQVFWFSGGV